MNSEYNRWVICLLCDFLKTSNKIFTQLFTLGKDVVNENWRNKCQGNWHFWEKYFWINLIRLAFGHGTDCPTLSNIGQVAASHNGREWEAKVGKEEEEEKSGVKIGKIERNTNVGK